MCVFITFQLICKLLYNANELSVKYTDSPIMKSSTLGQTYCGCFGKEKV